MLYQELGAFDVARYTTLSFNMGTWIIKSRATTLYRILSNTKRIRLQSVAVGILALMLRLIFEWIVAPELKFLSIFLRL